MRRSVLFLLLAAIALFSVAARTQSTWAPTPHYTVRVSVVPARPGPYHLLPGRTQAQYRATATVRDETNAKAIITTHDLLVSPGDRQTTSIESEGLTVELTVNVARNASGADTEVVVKRNGEVVTKSETAVLLASAS